MRQLIASLVALFFIGFSIHAFAVPAGGGGSGDLKSACEISGGTWTGSEGGNWACCWSDWGCYGCVDGQCKIKCNTERCRKANAAANAGPGVRKIPGLAPVGEKAPI